MNNIERCCATCKCDSFVFVFLFVGTNQSIIQLTFVYLDCSRLRLQDDRAASSAIPLLPYPTPPEKKKYILIFFTQK